MVGSDAGAGVSKQAKDANGFPTANIFFSSDSRHVVIQSNIGTVCTQITDLSGTVGAVRFVEITGTTGFHYKPAATKAPVSGALMLVGDSPYCPANIPKIIYIGDLSFIGVRAGVGQAPGTLHITLLT